MGSVCCVAARDKTVGVGSGSETQHRNVRHSPSWSFRWDHPGRVVGEEVSLNSISDGVSRNDRPEFKYESSYASEEGSPLEHYRRQTWKNSSVSEGSTTNVRTPTSGRSISRNVSTDVSLEQVKKATECATASTSPAKVSLSIPSTSSLSTSPLSTHSHIPSTGLTSSRLSHCSPGHRLLRQVSGNRIPAYKSPSSYTVSEDRRAIPGSIDSLRGSHGGSSDGWSMNAFSELMATSHRGRWSFGSESFDFAREKMVRSCSLFSPSPSADSQACGICSMLLVERSLWTSQKIIANNELSVVAVLTCGHVYHAECLESMTPEISKYDPACPICSFGEKQTLRMSEKALRGELESKIRNKRLRNRIADSGLDSESAMLDHFINTGQQGKCPKLSSSSSLRSSSGRGFLRRHFSFGSKGGTKALPESNNTAKRKGFLWSRSTKM
ncbi:uncharacterized protein LOC101210626 [Cucumis sativus]|uniref:RING-type domain-containing protein n=1 Tax=Cucumis sativus TaxID=3659 RepID=A0A0A0K4E4_CUCSA|nr:uncharacterized protein LOC101210626 [Cucumis sativus]KGN43152.1 hypothetical protein Csa_020423 [Cucumis sativus]